MATQVGLHLVHLEYKDDQLPAEEQLLWELEPRSRILEPTALPSVATADPMPVEDFDALLRAARWTSASPYLDPDGEGPVERLPISSPFHGAVQIEDYQLVPLLKALRMPRVNLLIADDVGLGKTIEAGLILSELLLRRRIQRVLILTPASLRLQWRDEMWDKFSLFFDLVDRYFSRSAEAVKGELFGVNRGKLLRWLLKVSYNSARATNEQVVPHEACRRFILGCSKHAPFPIALFVQTMPSEQSRQGDRVPNFLRTGDLLLPGVEEHVELRRVLGLNRFLFAIVGWKRRAPDPLRKQFSRSLCVDRGFQAIRRRSVRLRLGQLGYEAWHSATPGKDWFTTGRIE